MHSRPGCASSGGCRVNRAAGPESAHPQLIDLWLIRSSKYPTQTELHSQAVFMVCCHSKVDKIQMFADDLLPQLTIDHMTQKGNVYPGSEKDYFLTFPWGLGHDPSVFTGHRQNGQSIKPNSSLFFSFRDKAGLIGLAAALLGLYTTTGGLWSLAAVPWGLALLGWVGLRGVMLWRLGFMQRAIHTQATHLQTLVHNGKILTGLSRKALRLVQETEVISRGFTL